MIVFTKYTNSRRVNCMKKTLSLVLVTSIGVSLGFSSPISAQTNQFTDSKQQIKQFDDSKNRGIIINQNTDMAATENLLEKMGFNLDELSKMPDGLKKEIAQSGGKKVTLNLVQADKKTSEKQIRSAFNEPSFKEENGLNFNLFAMFEGTEGSNNIYRLYSTGYWTEIPYLKTNDTIGIFWDSKITPVKNENSARQTWFNPDDQEAYLKADESSPYGVQWKSPFRNNASMFGTYTSQKVKVPTQYNGTNIEVGAAFMHPWLKQQQEISLKFGPGTVEFNNVKGYLHTLKYKFIVGEK